MAAYSYGHREELLRDLMVKRSIVKSYNILHIDNFKSRWFVLTSDYLKYCEGTLEKGVGKEKRLIPLNKIKLVEAARMDLLDPNMQYGFQVWYDDLENKDKPPLKMYINAQNKSMQDQWISTIKQMCKAQGIHLLDRYHPGIWVSKTSSYTCCSQANKDAPPCTNVPESAEDMYNSTSSSQLSVPPSKIKPSRQSPTPSRKSPRQTATVNNRGSPKSGGQTPNNIPVTNDLISLSPTDDPKNTIKEHVYKHDREQNMRTLPTATVQPSPRNSKYVDVLYDYKSTQDGDLDITKGERLEIIDDKSESYWWLARNSKSQEGFVPSNYVTYVQQVAPVETYPWFFSNMTRQMAEMLLKEDHREGAYLVRKSEQTQGYTVGIFSTEGKRDGAIVKHYHIKKNKENQFYLSESHPKLTIPELIAYHSQNCAGLITRLRFYLHEKPAPPTAGLGHGQLVVSMADLNMERLLGAGNFGEVWKATFKGRTEVAVKKTIKGTLNDFEFVEEAKNMINLQHECLVQLYGICEKPDFLIITEYMEGGSLLDHLKGNASSLLINVPVLLDMCSQVARGMAYLESKKFIHRDLAARNCLVRRPNQVKVADFGLSRHVSDNEYISSTGSKFPIRWSSPEVLSFNKFSNKSDVWAFGVLTWEIFTGGETPYRRKNNAEVTRTICQDRQYPRKPNSAKQEIYDQLMVPCFKYREEDRPSFAEIVPVISTLRMNLTDY